MLFTRPALFELTALKNQAWQEQKFQDCSYGLKDLISLHKLGIKVLHDYKTNYVTSGNGKVVPHGHFGVVEVLMYLKKS